MTLSLSIYIYILVLYCYLSVMNFRLCIYSIILGTICFRTLLIVTFTGGILTIIL